MTKYLRAIETTFSTEVFGAEDADAVNRLREAATAHEFRLEQGKVASNGVGKVILIAPAAERRVEELLDVLRYHHPLGEHVDVNALPSSHARYVGEAHVALRELGEERGWDLAALDAVYRQVIDADYRFNIVQHEPKSNPARTCAVGVEWRTGQQLELGFTVTLKGDDTQWVPILSSPIGLGKIDTAAGKLAWQDDHHVILWHQNKRDFWRLDLRTSEVGFVYKPAEDGNPHGQYQLGKMYLDGGSWVERDETNARRWLQKSADQGFARAKSLLVRSEPRYPCSNAGGASTDAATAAKCRMQSIGRGGLGEP